MSSTHSGVKGINPSTLSSLPFALGEVLKWRILKIPHFTHLAFSCIGIRNYLWQSITVWAFKHCDDVMMSSQWSIIIINYLCFKIFQFLEQPLFNPMAVGSLDGMIIVISLFGLPEHSNVAGLS